MSVYDFNHNNEHHVNHTTNHATSNGASNQVAPAIRQYPVDNDYFSPGSNHLDMSVQLTRPISKTALLIRQRRGLLEQLSCWLCRGYLIDATTIGECMDSFCKSCILIYLRNNNNCPKCGTLIHKTNPLSTIRSDKVLQDIVYKLVPGLYDDEMKRRREFYKDILVIPSSDDSDDDDISSGSYNGGRGKISGSEQHGVISHPKPFYKPTDNIDLSLEPQTRGESSSIYYDNRRQSIITCFTGNEHQKLQRLLEGSVFTAVESQQFKTYLRCPAKLTVLQLKKFIAVKFNISQADTVHLLYLNESLKDEYSLIDIAYIYDWRRIEHMRLFYIVERDVSSMEIEVESQACKQTKVRHSVATSTQTTKRVFIDPEPKYYEEREPLISNTSGRSMRSRSELASRTTAKVIVGSTQAPILRSSDSSQRGSSTRREASNGVSVMQPGVSPGRSSSRLTSSVATISHPSSNSMGETKPRSESTCNSTSVGHSSSIPKININLNSLNRPYLDSRETSIYGKRIKIDDNHNHHHQSMADSTLGSNSNGAGNSTSHVARLDLKMPSGAGSSQSSLVTMASLTQTRSNPIFNMTTSSATTISNSGRNLMNPSSSSSPKLDNAMSSNKSVQNRQQLAFSIVTERGITIMNAMNRDEETQSTPSTSSPISTKSQSANIISLPNSIVSQNQSRFINNQAQPIVSSQISSSTTSVGEQSDSAGSSSGGVRNHVKVKPVYRTFVDPTKLKSPNFKKLGYTARH